MKKLSRKARVLILVVIFAAIAVAIAALLSKPAADSGGQKTTAARPAMTVTAVRPAEAELPIRLAANGNIAAWQEAIVGSEANGLRLAEVRVNVGDQVQAGQILAVFASETVAADVAQARASLMEADAAAADAAANAARARSLQDTGALSAQQIAQYVTLEQTAKAKVEAAKAMLSAQQLRMRHVQVLAPDHGIISSRTATVGAVVPGGTELFRLIRRGRLEWRAEVTASELARIQAGAPVTVSTAGGAQVRGKVRMVGPTVDPQSRMALVYVDLLPAPDQAQAARPGMFARGEFDLGRSRALTVPQQAVVMREGFSYVFRINPDKRVTQLKVATGRRIGDRVEITGGLPPDALIVASGAGFLNDGDVVRVVDAGSAEQVAANPAQAPAPAAR